MGPHDTGVTPGGRGRFPGYDVMREAPSWDPVTREVVEGRLSPPRGLRFFTLSEAATAGALVDRLLAQDEEPKIPVLEEVDRRLAEGQGDGYRYENLPPDPEAWRRSLAELDGLARQRSAVGFHELERHDQNQLLEDVRTSETLGDLPAARVWGLWLRYAAAAFYQHPYSWNEIGFGGPAYPRGYKNLGLDAREPWERPEVDARDPVPWAQRVEGAHGRRGVQRGARKGERRPGVQEGQAGSMSQGR